MNQPGPTRTALLVVHLQHDIVSPGTAFGAIFEPEATSRGVVARASEAMTATRDAGGLVVPLRIAFAPGHSDLRPTMPLLRMVADAGCLVDGSDGAELVDQLDARRDDPVITHQRPGPFTDSALQDLLDRRGVTAVAVCGVATNASVEGAARQAADLGYAVTVLADACSAADPAAHEASLASLGLFAEVVGTDDFAHALQGD